MVKRWRTWRIRKRSQVIKAGQQFPALPGSRTTARRSCGNWIYSGSWTEAGPQAARRGTEDPSGLGVYPNWGWSWPANRRVFITVRRAIGPANPWIRRESRFGGTKMRQPGPGMTCPTSKSIRLPKTTWGRSS